MMEKDKYTISELKEMLSYYVGNNGSTLGIIFFKAHLNEKAKQLPDKIKNIDNFIQENISDKSNSDVSMPEIENIYDYIKEIKKELKTLNGIKDEKSLHVQFKDFIQTWLEKLKAID